MIRLEHITKEFSSKNKKVTAVKDVSIHISKGEISVGNANVRKSIFWESGADICR